MKQKHNFPLTPREETFYLTLAVLLVHCLTHISCLLSLWHTFIFHSLVSFTTFTKTTILPGSTFSLVSGDGLLLSQCLVSKPKGIVLSLQQAARTIHLKWSFSPLPVGGRGSYSDIGGPVVTTQVTIPKDVSKRAPPPLKNSAHSVGKDSKDISLLNPFSLSPCACFAAGWLHHR